jgi:hypothetical protein
MKNWPRSLQGVHPHLLAWGYSGLLVLQIVLAFFVFPEPKLPRLRVVGWAIWALGCFFAIFPIFTLRIGGRVPEGRSYMETTTLVDTGIYAVVRHPQGGTAGILLSLALALIGQHWLLVLLAVVGVILIYMDTARSTCATWSECRGSISLRGSCGSLRIGERKGPGYDAVHRRFLSPRR